MVKLTDKQERFCNEYIVDLNATQAALRAGYSEKTAYSIGQENLKKPEIQNFIQELKQKRAERLEITQDQVLRELATLGFSNMQDYYDTNGDLLPVHALERAKTSAIQSIKKTVTTFDGGEKVAVEFKLYDKKSALVDIGRHIGFFELDNKQKDSVIKKLVIKPLGRNNTGDNSQ